MSKTKTLHIALCFSKEEGGQPYFECKHCGTTLETSESVADTVDLDKKFKAEHKNCEPMAPYKKFMLAAVSFIEKDLEARKETLASQYEFLSGLVFIYIRPEGKTRRKQVVYSGAANVLDGYRALNLAEGKA